MFTVTIKLPRESTGKEVADSFKSAATQISVPNKKWWEARVAECRFQYESNFTEPTIRSTGLVIRSSSLMRRCLFGPKVWSRDYTLTFYVKPIVLAEKYNEVDIEVEYISEVGMAGDDKVATNLLSPEFKPARPQFEALINEFFIALQAKTG